jgi:2OG-Fe(II) oxygenase superfamily
LPLLLQPGHHEYPFPFFHWTSAFSLELCDAFEKTFSPAGGWQHRDAAFYQCSLRDVTGEIPADIRLGVVARMREITGLPLVDRVEITAQRMMPGQRIGVHSDRPLAGFEFVRLVVQLNRQWQPDHGGVLELFAQPDNAPVYRVNPGYNEAFGFLLHVDSHHAVTEVTQPRRTVVFNFWHAANTPELAHYVQNLFAAMHFSELPAAVNPFALAAESSLPEDTTYHAGVAAVALHRWGYDDATVVAGYLHSAGLATAGEIGTEARAAALLADWIARLYRDPFDLARWETLRSALNRKEAYTRLMPAWYLCLP